jgi:hypothetical protein
LGHRLQPELVHPVAPRAGFLDRLRVLLPDHAAVVAAGAVVAGGCLHHLLTDGPLGNDVDVFCPDSATAHAVAAVLAQRYADLEVTRSTYSSSSMLRPVQLTVCDFRNVCALLSSFDLDCTQAALTRQGPVASTWCSEAWQSGKISMVASDPEQTLPMLFYRLRKYARRGFVLRHHVKAMRRLGLPQQMPAAPASINLSDEARFHSGPDWRDDPAPEDDGRRLQFLHHPSEIVYSQSYRPKFFVDLRDMDPCVLGC